MKHAIESLTRIALILFAITLMAAACSPTNEATPSISTLPVTVVPITTAETTAASIDDLAGLPPEARASTGGGDPRPPAYWAVWNTCAPDNRAAEAKANGGRAAGWVLVDDVLADPGIGLGDHLLTSCEESVALLRGLTGVGTETSDPAFDLAGQLLAAELNLTVGAETCPVAEEAVVGAHLVLSSANFDGVSVSPLDAEAGGALPRLVNLLSAYNRGELCLP